VHRAVLRSSVRSVAKDQGLVPPPSPHFDVRTPEYTVFPDIQRRPWECVRGIDRSFGFNRASDPSHFLSRQDLLTSVADIASKNGNLMLNVGPRGEDGAIPDEQLARLDWMAGWTGGLASPGVGIGEALFGTRPWVRPSATSPEGHELRFTAKDRDLHVVVLSGPDGPVTVQGVQVEPSTEVRRAGGGPPVAWSAVPGGLRLDLGERGEDPVAAVVTGSAAAPLP
jgi:alpha-L-fucosidase